ncbi:MAG TPA: gp436 family protein [Candidatus Wunengus sp. YC60]|uniref:gp436 family protein n=1 Tax=Candidatus Wunengus sp. YC60 TaxID=3367697 RepID=UPI004029F30F
MAYAIIDDIKKLIPEEAVIQLTDDEETGSVNTTRVNEAIAQADAEIDSYCARLYTIPFSPVPDLVRKFSVDMAIYHLFSRRIEEMPEIRKDRYQNAIKQLESIAKGIMSLGEQPEPAQPSGGSVRTNKTIDDRIFTSDMMKGY